MGFQVRGQDESNVQVPRFKSDWTRQMGQWIEEATSGMPHEVEGMPYEGLTVQSFIEDHWDQICESWGDKGKWGRVIGCLTCLPWIVEYQGFVDSMYSASQCWAEGHDWEDQSTCILDYGDVSMECRRCGLFFHRPLY